MHIHTSIRAVLKAAALCLGLMSATQAGAAVIQQSAGSAHVAWEAETESTIVNGTQTFWETINDATASGGAALYIGGTTANGTAPHSFVQYQIKFAQAGTYHLYYRWKADPARTVADQFTANSALFANAFGALSTPGDTASVHTSASNGTQAPGNNVYDWQREADTATYEVTAAHVAAGVPLILTIGTREAGMTIDRWVMHSDPSLTDATLDAMTMSDTSLVVQGAADTFVAFEAESKGALVNGTQTFWEPISDVTASGNGALYIGGTTANGTAPHSFVQYAIRFRAAGTYNLYYRWKADPARTVADQFTANSALIANAFGAFSTPGDTATVHTSASNGTQAPGNNVYDWQREADTATYEVTATQVAAGVPLILTIGTREAGMTIDRWVLHPDATLTDAALDALPNSGAVVAGPELVKAVGSAALNTVRVFFTRPLAPASILGANKFSISGGLNVTGATLDPDDARQVVLTTSAATPGTEYTITVNGVTDTSGNAIKANSTVKFSAWKLAEGWATTEIFLNVTGTLVDDLKNAAAFLAGKPDEVRWVKGFQLNNSPRAPNMGSRISAFFSPAASGPYNFYVNNDNEAELLLSTDQSAANLQSLGTFQLSPAVFDDAIVAQSPSLTANQKYLLTGLVKSDGGDVYLNVAAQGSSSSTPAASLSALGGARISTYVNPDLGKVTFAQQPANVTATAGARAQFSVKAEATEAPIYYQWQADGVNIEGATRATFVTPVLTGNESGRKYRVVVSVAGRDTISNEATLTVTPGEPSNLQPYIGLNFVGGGDNIGGVVSRFDVAGVAQQENWNNIAGFQVEGAALADASGAATPVTVTAAGSSEHWYSGTIASGSANGVMLQGFLSAGASTEPMTLTFNNVPSGNYNVVVYSIGFPFQAAYEEDITVTGGGSYPTYRVKAESGLEFNANPAFRRMTSTDASARAMGNYVQFDNVAPAGDGSITVSAQWVSTEAGNGHQPAINGVQLVKVNPVTVRPTLTVARQGASLTLGWGAPAVGFVLETSATVGAGASWTAVPGAANPLTGAGTVNVNASAGGRAFYRLRK